MVCDKNANLEKGRTMMKKENRIVSILKTRHILAFAMA
jgi:hypothetical protein